MSVFENFEHSNDQTWEHHHSRTPNYIGVGVALAVIVLLAVLIDYL